MSTEFCNRYRERNVPNPREMLALRDTPVDLAKWQPISFGRTPSGKVAAALAVQGYLIIERTTDLLTRAARRYRKGPVRNSLAGLSAAFRSHG